MDEKEKQKKEDIKPPQIEANIYDSVELIVDIHGLTRQDIDNALKDLNEILPATKYARKEDSLTDEEINDYGDRRENGLSGAVRKRYLDTESIVRYYSKDETEIITISRLFISIYLSYEVAHNLRDNIVLMDNIVNAFDKIEYFEVEKIFLVKKDSIYCSSLEQIYQCFNQNLFADMGYFFECFDENDTIDTGVTRVYNNFSYGDVEVAINKEIMPGTLIDTGEPVFECKMDMVTAVEPVGDSVEVANELNRLNRVSFTIFMSHITDSFAEDLKKGSSDKVRKGLNYYGKKN